MSVPDLRLTAVDGTTVSLLEASAEQPTILIFYRGGWCPFCSTQLGQLQARLPELHDLGYRIMGISPDTPDNLRESIGKHELLLPVPAVFVLDSAGRITFSYVNPDYKVRLDPDLMVAAAKAALDS